MGELPDRPANAHRSEAGANWARRLVGLAVVLGMLLLVLGVVTGPGQTKAAAGVDKNNDEHPLRLGGAGQSRVTKPGWQVPTSWLADGLIPADFARAFAYAGMEADRAAGLSNDPLPSLSAAEAALLDQARAALASQPSSPGGLSRGGADGGGTAQRRGAGAGPLAGSTSSSAEQARATATYRAGLGSVAPTSEGMVLRGTPWAAVNFDPAKAGRTTYVIQADSDEVVVQLFPDDAGQVRLNGGAIVPGRSYRVGRAAVIETATPVGIQLRPVAAVPMVHEEPLRIPLGTG